MAYTESGGPTRGDVKVVALATGEIRASVETPFDETDGALSPDGRLLAYQSDESGRWEIYLLKLDDRQRIPVSSSGGRDPMWSANGTFACRIEQRTQPCAWRLTRPAIRLAHQSPSPRLPAPRSVGIAGDRILARVGGEAPSSHAVLTLEWARDLQRILGPPATALPR